MDKEFQTPYVSKELCAYLRDAYSLSNSLYNLTKKNLQDEGQCLGFLVGVNEVISTLEAINAQQEAEVN